MIREKSILFAVNKVLNDNFPDCEIVMEENISEVKKPTFITNVELIDSNSFKGYTKDLVKVYIYYTDDSPYIIDLLDVKRALKRIFDLTLEVGETKLVIDKKAFKTRDKFVTLELTFNFINGKENIDEPYDKSDYKMQELHCKGVDVHVNAEG